MVTPTPAPQRRWSAFTPLPGRGVRIAACLALLLIPCHLSPGRNLADYHLGDTAEQDIVAPIALSVVDPVATEALKRKEAASAPVVVRLNRGATAEAEAAFHAAFDTTQKNFLDAVERSFGRRVLSTQDLASPAFADLAAAFQRENRLFPLSTNRAALWAGGDPDREYRESLAATLRQAMNRPIQPQRWPADLRPGSPLLRVTVQSADEPLSVESAAERGVVDTNLVTLAAARTALQNLFLADERLVSRHLAGFLRPNCVADEALTEALRAKRIDGLWATARYEPGDIIVRRGEIVDPKVKAAFDQIEERTALGQLQQFIARDEVKAREDRWVLWLTGVLAAAVLMLALAAWQLARRRAPATLLPARIGHDVLSGAELSDAMTGEAWRERALLAERQARRAQEVVRTGLLSHLAQWMSGKLTQRLLSQHAQLIRAEREAAADIAEFEERLKGLHAPIEERLRAYERRIAELERELAVKGEENRALIKAKIEMARRQMELERGRKPVEFN